MPRRKWKEPEPEPVPVDEIWGTLEHDPLSDGRDGMARAVAEAIAQEPAPPRPSRLGKPKGMEDPPAPAPAAEGSGDASRSAEEEVRRIVRRSGGSASASLVSYRGADGRIRSVVLDVNCVLVEDAWKAYKKAVPDASPMGFIKAVCKAQGKDFPKILSAVCPVMLE